MALAGLTRYFRPINQSWSFRKRDCNCSSFAWATGTPHGVVHTKLRTVCGGPPVAQANEEQLQSRLRKLQDWFIGRK